MGKIIHLKDTAGITKKLRDEGKTIILAGGCFDILHLGHIKFLTAAKKESDVLVVALESDENVEKLKGKGRPINSQLHRAQVLAALAMVDYVVLLPYMRDDADYFSLVEKIKPDIVAVTSGDPQIENKEQQAKKVGGRVKVVTPVLITNSTTKIAKILQSETTL